MKFFFILLTCTSFSSAFSQTKLLFHKSHSGTAFSYAASLSSNPSNFGMAPTRRVESAALDSVVFLSDTSAIMITSNYCEYRGYYAEPSSPPRSSSLWKPGRDTVYNHPLFSHRHSLDSIRAVLATQYNFRNAIDSTAFIGYDNAGRREETLPVRLKQRPSKQNDLYLVLVFVSVFLLFGLVLPKRVFEL